MSARCDGVVDGDDEIFLEAITVEMPDGDLPAPSGAIARIKAREREQFLFWGLGSVPQASPNSDGGWTVFVQLMQGKTSDKEGLRRQLDRWMSELRPGATGFLGTTAGVTDDGKVFMAARFESEAAARANSDRPEQSAWWSETEKYFDGPVTFVDSSDIQVQVEPSNNAGFVQVIQSKALDRKRIEEINDQVTPAMTESRPEIVGAVSVWSADHVCDIAYFTTEEAAREGETSELPDAHRKLFEEWQSLIEQATYLDIKDPWLY